MNVFVTGATGFVGSVTVKELLKSGHQVLGLARSDAGAKLLESMGAQVHRGDLDDLESLRKGAANADAVIHTGFNHDFTKFAANCEADRKVVTALADVLAGSKRPLVVTSGTALVSGAREATEAEGAPKESHNPRVASEQAVDAAAERGVHAIVMRLPPSVHGQGDHGFVPMLINLAREKGVAVYQGEGQNVWPAVHRLDAAKLYRLAVEKSASPGTRLHANAERGVAFKDIATMIGKHLGVPVVSKSAEDAAAHFGWFAHFAAINNLTSSQKTRDTFGWKPTEAGLIADLDHDYYFKT